MTPSAASASEWSVPGLAQLFEIVLDAAAEQRDISIGEHDQFFAVGQAASETGHSLSGLIEAYLSGAGQLWEQVFATTEPGHAVGVGRALRRVSERAVSGLASGFETAQRRSIRAEEALRREFFDDLLTERSDSGSLEHRAGIAGFPVADHYVVAVADADRILSDAGPLLARVRSELQSRYPQRRLQAFTKGGQLVIVAPDAEPRQLDLAAALSSVESVSWRAGIGGRCHGLGDLSRSYDEAREAIRLGRAFDLGSISVFDDLLAHRLLAADRHVAEALVGSVVSPLVDAPRGSLLETLEVFISQSGNMAAVARQLSLGPRTVAYRLERIADLTGYAPRDPDGRFTLELALRCRPLVATSARPIGAN